MNSFPYPDVRGMLRGFPVFIVGASPSLDEMPGIWELLSDPEIITVGINTTVKHFSPNYWFMTDCRVIRELVPREVTRRYPGIRVWAQSYIKSYMDDHGLADLEILPWGFQGVWDKKSRRFETESIGKIQTYGNSDSYAAQVFGGVMRAGPIYYVGVDHRQTAAGQTHCGGERRKNKHGKPHGGPSKEKVRCSLEALSFWATKTATSVFTCSPWPDTVVRQFLPHKDLREAIEEARRLGSAA